MAKLGIEIPPELLAVGGTITIQKRRVSVTRTADPNANQPVAPPSSPINNDHQLTSPSTTTTTTTKTTTQVPSNNSNQLNSTSRPAPSVCILNIDDHLLSIVIIRLLEQCQQ